jgi:carboxyl-terminal processing protease
MSQEKYQKVLRTLGIFVLVLAVFVIGAYAGTKKSVAQIIAPKQTALAAISNTNLSNADLSQFWYVWNLLDQKYPFKDHAPEQSNKVYGAISGLVSSYKDPYTVFFPPQEAKLFSDQVKGSFGGVGMEVGLKNGLVTVIAPMKDSPAEKAGIKAGDIITEINKKKADDLSIDTAVSLIRGDVGTTVDLGIARKGATEIQHIVITREIVKLPIIDTKEVGDVFVISLYSFSEDSAQLFTDALKKFNDSGKQKLVLDLRNNPGGYLEAAVDIASYFLPAGKTIVKENSGGAHAEVVHQSKGYTLLPKNPNMIVLINGGSASASEILAGALSEQGVAKLVGTTSFGKGSVQEVLDLPDHSSVKITVAKWLTPNGVSISEKGIVPPTAVEDKPVKDAKTGKYNDPQLEAALKLLK